MPQRPSWGEVYPEFPSLLTSHYIKLNHLCLLKMMTLPHNLYLFSAIDHSGEKSIARSVECVPQQISNSMTSSRHQGQRFHQAIQIHLTFIILFKDRQVNVWIHKYMGENAQWLSFNLKLQVFLRSTLEYWKCGTVNWFEWYLLSW